VSWTYFVDLTGVGGDVVLGLNERASGVVEQRADELTVREHVTGRTSGSRAELDVWAAELDVWSDEVQVRLCHLGLLRRPRDTAADHALHRSHRVTVISID